MIKTLTEKITKEIAAKKIAKHTNQWNVLNQLIDIISLDEQAAEIVLQDLEIKEMSLENFTRAMVSKKELNPLNVVKNICEFYGIKELKELPAEQWRTEKTEIKENKKTLNILDFMD